MFPGPVWVTSGRVGDDGNNTQEVTMQIYKVQLSTTDEYKVDKDRGLILDRHEAMLPADDDRIVHEGQTYEIQPDGTFHVPDELGEWLTRAWDSPWKRGANPFFADRAAVKPAPRKRASKAAA